MSFQKLNQMRAQCKERGLPIPKGAKEADLARMLNGVIPAEIQRALRICKRNSPNAAKRVIAYIDELRNAHLG